VAKISSVSKNYYLCSTNCYEFSFSLYRPQIQNISLAAAGRLYAFSLTWLPEELVWLKVSVSLWQTFSHESGTRSLTFMISFTSCCVLWCSMCDSSVIFSCLCPEIFLLFSVCDYDDTIFSSDYICGAYTGFMCVLPSCQSSSRCAGIPSSSRIPLFPNSFCIRFSLNKITVFWLQYYICFTLR
jgi:hypothetical protein